MKVFSRRIRFQRGNLTFAVLLWLACCLLTAAPKINSSEVVFYPETAAFFPGQHDRGADPQLDDRSWQTLPFGDFPREQWNGSGWFRLVLRIDPSLCGRPLILDMPNFGAKEVFIDGQAVFRLGRVGQDRGSETAVINRDLLVFALGPKQPGPDGKLAYLFAIHLSAFQLQTTAWQGVSPSYAFRVEPLKNQITQDALSRKADTFHQMLLSGVFLSFFLIHALLYYFDRKFRANFYFAWLNLTCGMVVFFNFQAMASTDLNEYLQYLRMAGISFILMASAIIGTAYTISLYDQTQRLRFLFIPLALPLAIWTWLQPFRTQLYLSLLIFLVVGEVFWVWMTTKMGPKREPINGVWIIGWGSLPVVVVGIHHGLLSSGLIEPSSRFEALALPFYAMVVLSVSISIFLARDFAMAKKNLQIQLAEVKSLTEKTGRRDRERVLLIAEHARRTQELEEARKQQLSMLPKTLPRVPGLEIDVFMKTAKEVGGDYYDFKYHPEQGLMAVIGDATGQGLKAGTLVVAAKSLFYALGDLPDPAGFLNASSQAIRRLGLRKMFMTMTAAHYQNKRLMIASAGMPPVFVFRSDTGSVSEISLKSLPLGAPGRVPYHSHCLQLRAKDTVLFMSDGFSELFNEKNEMFGVARIRDLFAQAAQQPTNQIIGRLVAAGQSWAKGRMLDDDVSLMVFKQV